MHTLANIYQTCLDKNWQGTICISSTEDLYDANVLQDALISCRSRYESIDIRFGDKIILQVTHSIDSIIALITLWNMGAIVVPVKNNTSEKEIDSIAKDCNARFLVCFNQKIIPLGTYVNKRKLFMTKLPQKVSGSDLALIIYTSGSTGQSKGIMLTHNNVVTALDSIVNYLELSSEDTILCISPLSFDYGLYQILFSFKVGCKVVLFNETVQPLAILKVISQFSVTVLPVVPTIACSIERILHLYDRDLGSLQKITNTGGHLPEPTILKIRKQLPKVKIYAMYGLTESKRALYLPPHEIDRKLGSVGIPMPGLEAKIFNKIVTVAGTQYVEAEPDEVGMLYVRGPSVMQGYCNSENESGAKIISGEYREDNWLSTGDLFSRDAEGFFYFKGRDKELIKQGGYCIYPRDIEQIVTKHPNVQFSITVCEFDDQGTEIAHLFIRLYEDSPENRLKARTWVIQAINADYLPRKISFVSEVPVTANGKIDKRKLALAQ